MKYLLPLLLLPLLAACSHEHEHEHVSLYTAGLPYSYITRVDPPLTEWGTPPIGVLTKRIGEIEIVEIQFSRYVHNFEVVDLNLPWLLTTPVGTKGLARHINKAIITTGCDDPAHSGYIAFRVSWDITIGQRETRAEVDFMYTCPDAAPIPRKP